MKQLKPIQGCLIYLGAVVLKMLLFIPLYVWSFRIALKEKRLGNWWYEQGRGLDIAANKTFEPVFNRKLRKPESAHRFGGDVTISYDMAIQKRCLWQTELADKVEAGINFFDKDHLNKTLKNYHLN